MADKSTIWRLQRRGCQQCWGLSHRCAASTEGPSSAPTSNMSCLRAAGAPSLALDASDRVNRH